ncbi:hypothetical protein TPHA_0F02840 [Tetrapisispora phaffii CBS 4417]|uniref:CBS domain-containing protein n=1 Tax=Tetrapisispora phaffii (strain ATCC 24235 / CBS 4417 / NBRC 1672 / NRRL Y-8282 / UCD 70-5) TaxID=1071381 RepID=G8BUH9_TETPH|nr:hypothetical protein TPHA_0F02840 [Tetrapisispora phaffii CBS 4417]CCE63765.1 hypothetical protein TPHA_0F02840 [Tetrapisispora phaffii CBS 4417]
MKAGKYMSGSANNSASNINAASSTQRHNSIMELLSTPPQLPHNPGSASSTVTGATLGSNTNTLNVNKSGHNHHFNKSRQSSNLNDGFSQSASNAAEDPMVLGRTESFSSADSISSLSITSSNNHFDMIDNNSDNNNTNSIYANITGNANNQANNANGPGSPGISLHLTNSNGYNSNSILAQDSSFSHVTSTINTYPQQQQQQQQQPLLAEQQPQSQPHQQQLHHDIEEYLSNVHHGELMENGDDRFPSHCISSVHAQKWQHIKLSQLIEQNKLITIEGSISIEEAFNTLVKYHLTSLPVEQFSGDMDCLSFDYNDLNSYLLLVLNKISVNNEKVTQDCQNGKPVPVGEIIKLTPKNPACRLPESENLSTVMGILGSGVHRVIITDNEITKMKGILSQRRLVKYLWDNARSFPSLEPLLNSSLKDLQIGVFNLSSKPTSDQSRVISIRGEEPLIMALYKMHTESISSIAVVDNQLNLIGNISVTDVKHVTRTSQYPLLHKTCRHFISIILNSRGLENGKDSFPIFHVYPTSSLARTLAKLVATKSHRLWIVQPPEQQLNESGSASTSTSNSTHSPIMTALDYSPSQTPNVSPTNLFEKEYRTGKLIGVVSLTDILSVLARKQTDNKEVDPQSARRQRGYYK